MMNRVVSWIVTIIIICELVLVFASWVLSALMIEGVQSLISSESLRWFFGEFTNSLLSPLLLWIIIMSIAYGCMIRSRILKSSASYRERIAHRVSLGVMLLSIIAVALLTLVPHAILLSSMGNLFPSPFSRALIPIIAFIITLTSVVFGVITHTFTSMNRIIEAMIYGLLKGAPILICYLFLWQFYVSLKYVFELPGLFE